MRIRHLTYAVVALITLGCVDALAQDGGRPTTRNVAILVFEGVQIIDFSAPWELFDTDPGFSVFSVGEHVRALQTTGNMTLVPTYGLDDHPPVDVLVLPGGNIYPHLDNPEIMNWVTWTADRAEIVLTVCNGAFLGGAGLLDGKQATTTSFLLGALQNAAPTATVVSDRRYVDNVNIVTAGGLSAGIDATLHVIERLQGRARAQLAALAQEYNWDPSGT